MRYPASTRDCPACNGPLAHSDGGYFACLASSCGAAYLATRLAGNLVPNNRVAYLASKD